MVFILTSVIPSWSLGLENSASLPSDAEVKALEWLRDNSEENATVLGTPLEGDMISFFSRRKNVMDDNYVLIPEIDFRYEEIESAFKTRFETKSLEILDKYSVDYIYLSDRARALYSIDDLAYVEERCFPLVYEEGGIKIYEVRCQVK